jgi:hypothetical protein
MRIVLFILLIVNSLCLQAQGGNSILEKFNANVVGDQMLLSWRIKAGNTCNGIEVYRSTDSLNFEWLGNVEGICGNLSFPVDYEFVDTEPVPNAINYYRLNLGGSGFSNVISAWYYDFSEQEYLLTPNPVEETAVLRFRNDAGLEVELTIYDLMGNMIVKEATNTDNFILQANRFEPGQYMFQLQSEVEEGEIISGKVLFAH